MLALLYTVLDRIRGFLRPADIDAEIEQEIDAHLAIAEDDKVRSGMARAEARRIARMELGGVAQVREAGRAARGLPRVDSLWLDVKLGGRMLRKTWGLTLAGGLALTTAISIAIGLFNIYQSITGTALPLEEGDRVVSLMVWDAADQESHSVALRDVERWRQSLRSVVNLGAFRTVERDLVVDNRRSEPVSVAEITASGFDVARVPAFLGRSIRADDERPGAEAVVVIGHEVWVSKFSSDPRVLGQTVQLDGRSHTVIGVMPDTFAFPINHQYWTTLKASLEDSRQSREPSVIAFGRLAAGVELPVADAEIRAVGLLRTANEDGNDRPRVMSYVGGVTGTGGGGAFSQTFLILTAGLLLLPPCANMAILIYARTVTRQREFTTRHALGGSRARIVGQLYLEALLLVAGATFTSLVVVSQVGKYFQTMIRLPHGNPFWLDFGVIQLETMLFALGIGGLAAVIVGIAPALQAVGRLTDAAALGGRSSLKLGAAWTGMVAVQVALSIAVIPVVAEVAWGTIRPAIGGPGFAADRFLTAHVTLGRAEDSTLAERGEAKRFERLQTELVRRLESLPEVTALIRSAVVPGTERQVMIDVDDGDDPVTGTDGVGGPRQVLVRSNAVEAAFFDAFDMEVMAGRMFDRTRGQTGQVVVNRALARHLAGDGNPVGWRLRDRPARDARAESGPWHEIVGIVDDQHASNGHRTLYRPLPEDQHPLTLSMKLTSGSPHLAQRLRNLGAEIDSDLHVSAIRSLADVERDSTRGVYLVGLTLGFGALSVLLLSAAGIYALMSFTVARRRREIGIRSALGARATWLLVGILGRAARQIVIGAVAGVLAALWLGAYLPVESIGGARVPGVIAVAASIMTTVGLLAAAGPARRALRLDPTEALRDN